MILATSAVAQQLKFEPGKLCLPLANLPSVALGRFPTPTATLAGKDGARLWIKNDGVSATVYGGNKVRKLELLLGRARAKGKKRIVTCGAAGSHHVLATTIYGIHLGFEVVALLAHQPHSEHAEATLVAALEHGLEPIPLDGLSSLAPAISELMGASSFLIGPGGCGSLGTLAYVSAALELGAQVETGELPPPEAIFVAAGSGSTAAGLLAGTALSSLANSVICCVQVTRSRLLRAAILAQAAAALRILGRRANLKQLNQRLHIDHSWVGGGYGHATADGRLARDIAAEKGICLDDTYTAKACAAALASVDQLPGRARAHRRYSTVLYWHTLSSTAPTGLLEGRRPLPDRLRQLFTLA